MRFDITRQPLGVVLAQFALFLLLFWSRAQSYPTAVELQTLSPGFALSGLLDNLLSQLGGLKHLVMMGIVFTNAILITRVVTTNMIVGMRTYLPVLIYVIVSCGLYMGGSISGYLVATLTIQGSYYLINAFRRLAGFDAIFKGGLLLGIAPLLSFETVLLFIPVIVALIIFRRSGREAIVVFTGFLLPMALYSYIYWGMGYEFEYVALWGWHTLELFAHASYNIGAIGIGQLVFISLVVLAIFLSVGTFVANLSTMRNRASRIYSYFIVLFVLFLLMFFLPCRSTLGYSLVAIPVAVMMPLYFVKHHNRTSAAIYILLLTSIVAINVVPFIR